MPASVFIDGEAGTTGLQIHDRLVGREDIALIKLDDAQRKDPAARQEALRAADIAILCLPDAAAREAVALTGDAPTKIIDASTAHRVAPGWTYGFAEMTEGHARKIGEARFVSNPGCYPTGAIGLIRPLRDAGLIPADARLSISAVSGYSGGGRTLIEDYESGSAPSQFVYGLAQAHKHLPEITAYCQLTAAPSFVPSVGAFRQGMIVQVPLFLDQLRGKLKIDDIHTIVAAHYVDSSCVHVVDLADTPARIDAEAMNDTNDMTIHIAGNPDSGTVVMAAVLDNLGKGASGAAVQNLDLMLGL